MRRLTNLVPVVESRATFGYFLPNSKSALFLPHFGTEGAAVVMGTPGEPEPPVEPPHDGFVPEHTGMSQYSHRLFLVSVIIMFLQLLTILYLI